MQTNLGTPIEVARSLEYVVFEMTRSRDIVRITQTWKQLNQDYDDSLFDISPDIKIEIFRRGKPEGKLVYYMTFETLEKANKFYDEVIHKLLNIVSAILIFEEIDKEEGL